MSASAIIVGIDEAGYGPVLGPLVVSASAFEVPLASAATDLWRLLKTCVAKKASSRDARVCILDSKKLFKPTDGVGRLERTVLSVTGAWQEVPPDLHQLLRLVAPDAIAKLQEYPWYHGANPQLPRPADASGVNLAATVLRRNMDSLGIRPAGLWSEVLPEGHYNRLVSGTQNKAVVLLGLTLRLIQRVSDAHPHSPIHFYIDKQGAREHYANPLLRAFEGRRLRVVLEDETTSAYELVNDASHWRISFHMSGESKHLPVAMASCLSKYLREVIMECFNDFWLGHIPALKPTAGYYQDGMRFINDIEEQVRVLGIDRKKLVRMR